MTRVLDAYAAVGRGVIRAAVADVFTVANGSVTRLEACANPDDAFAAASGSQTKN